MDFNHGVGDKVEIEADHELVRERFFVLPEDFGNRNAIINRERGGKTQAAADRPAAERAAAEAEKIAINTAAIYVRSCEQWNSVAVSEPAYSGAAPRRPIVSVRSSRQV